MRHDRTARPRLDREALLLVLETADEALRTWLRFSYGLGPVERPAYGLSEQELHDGESNASDYTGADLDGVARNGVLVARGDDDYTRVVVARFPRHPWPRMERITRGKRRPRALHLDELDALPVPGRRVL